jgi:hypothetical protein
MALGHSITHICPSSQPTYLLAIVPRHDNAAVVAMEARAIERRLYLFPIRGLNLVTREFDGELVSKLDLTGSVVSYGLSAERYTGKLVGCIGIILDKSL